MNEDHHMKWMLRTYLKKAQADIIAVVLLVGVSLTVGLGVVALFVSQSSLANSQLDISNTVYSQAMNEYLALVFHGSIPINDTYSEHLFLFKLVKLARTGNNYFNVIPLITLGNLNKILFYETNKLWASESVYVLKPNISTGNFSNAPDLITTINVKGTDINLMNGLGLEVVSAPVFKVIPSINDSVLTAYIEIKVILPNEWHNFYLTLATLTEISGKFYVLNKISIPLGGG